MLTLTPIKHIVLQPTSLCNLNCSYCYIPTDSRRRGEFVTPATVEAVARLLQEDIFDADCEVVLHGGEPLAAGPARLANLIKALRTGVKRPLRFNIQTNGTLISERWDAVLEDHGVTLGLSLDFRGDLRRVDWRGRSSVKAALRGLEILQSKGRDVSVVAVVDPRALPDAHEFLAFFAELGVKEVGINLEEFEGANAESNNASLLDVHTSELSDWWGHLWRAWERNAYSPSVREFRHVVSWSARKAGLAAPVHLWPTVSLNGDVRLLSPEFASVTLPADRFPVLNIVHQYEHVLAALRAPTTVPYVTEFLHGVDRCSATCNAFDLCGGGFASNKFFERGRLDVTRHPSCEASILSLVEGLVTVSRTSQRVENLACD